MGDDGKLSANSFLLASSSLSNSSSLPPY
jgi:hypothetical protein